MMILYQVNHSLLINTEFQYLYNQDNIYDCYEMAMERVSEIVKEERNFVRVWITQYYLNSDTAGFEIYTTDSITETYVNKRKSLTPEFVCR